jgi:PAS domain S-box-containing protein
MFILDRESLAFLDVNHAAIARYGYSREEFLRMTIDGLRPEEDAGAMRGPFQRITPEAGAPQPPEAAGIWRHRGKDGVPIHVEATWTAITFRGRPAFLVVAGDIGERIRIERELRDSEERFRRLVEVSPDAVLVEVEGRIVFCNSAGARLLGAGRPEQLQGKPLLDVVHPDDGEIVVRWVRRLAEQDGALPSMRTRLLRLDGTAVDVETVAAPLGWEGRPATKLIARDISLRTLTEQRLQASERQLMEAQQVGHVGSWEWDFAADTFAWSDEFFRILGLEPGSVPQQHDSFMERTHPEDRAALEGLRERLRQAPGPFAHECRVLRPDRSVRVVHVRGEVIRDAAGRAMRLVGVCQDITERRPAEAERARHAAQLQALARASLVVNSAKSLEEVTRTVTEAARQIIGAHMSVTSFTVDQRWAQAIDARSLSDKYAAFKDYNARPDGSGIYRLVCQTNRPMRLTQSELEAHPEFRRFGNEAGRHPVLRGWLAAPLIGRDGRNLGLVQLSDKHEGEFTEDDEAILVQLAQMASIAIENVRLLLEVTDGHERLRTLSRRLVELQESERRLIARELHDEVGQLLTGLKLMLETGDPAGRSAEAGRIADDLLRRVRNLSMDLRPPMLDDLGLIAALHWHLERYTAQTGVRVDFHHAGLDRRYPLQVEVAAFRVVQEALTNVARHAGVPEATVHVWTDEGRLGVRVEDRGTGFEVAAPRAGTSTGLQGMRERVGLLGGRLTIESTPGSGTQLTADLPLAAAADRRAL